MELRDYWHLLRKRWRLIALIPLIAALGAVVVNVRSTSKYESHVRFFVSTPATSDTGSAYSGGLFSQQRVKSYVGLLAGPRLADQVQKDLGSSIDGYKVRGTISAQSSAETVLINVTVTDSDPRRAAAIAASVGRVFPGMVEALEKPPSGGVASIRATVVADPEVATSPVSPKPVRNIALAIVVGGLLGLGAAVAREALDQTVKTPDDLRELVDLATLGAIAFDARAVRKPLVVHDEPHSQRAEAFRQLRTNLQFVEVDQPLRSLVITSPLPREGKSTSACNLAITLAQVGVNVLLVEADLRRPKIAEYLGLEGAVGLTSVLIGAVSLEDAVQQWGEDGLNFLASGPLPPNPSELLASVGMHDLLKELEDKFEIVIIDAPPLLPVTDAAILAAISSGALFCIRAGKVRNEQVRRAIQSLTAVDATVLGAVLTMVPTRGPDAYHYGYGYGYYSYRADKLDKLSVADAFRAVHRITRNGDAPTRPRPSPSPGKPPRPPVSQPVAPQPVESEMQPAQAAAARTIPDSPPPYVSAIERLRNMGERGK